MPSAVSSLGVSPLGAALIDRKQQSPPFQSGSLISSWRDFPLGQESQHVKCTVRGPESVSVPQVC